MLDPIFWRPRTRHFLRNRGNSLHPIRGMQFWGKSAHPDNLYSRSQETIFREINSSLPVNAGWNTCCAMVSHARRSIDTFIVLQRRVQLIQCQCKLQLQIANLGLNNAFLIKSSLFDPPVWGCLHLPSCLDTETVPQQIKSAWLVDIPLAVYAHQNKAALMTQNGLKYDHKSAK